MLHCYEFIENELATQDLQFDCFIILQEINEYASLVPELFDTTL